MMLSKTNIPEILVLEPRVFEDQRGAFFEAYNQKTFSQLGISKQFVQDNQSDSKRNVLRGLHYQVCRPQGKLVRVLQGEIYDVAVDCRRISPTFGKFVDIVLSAENRKMLWIPEGFAHGFLVLSDKAEVLYKTTDFYEPECERTILWNDSTLAIPWPCPEPLVSEKDRKGRTLREAQIFE